MTVQRTRDDLLRQNHSNDPNFRRGLLSNHASMAILALEQLGATDGQIRSFYDAYHGHLSPLEPDGVDRAAIEQALLTQGWEVVLRERLPALAEGLGGDAFHGWIRTAYAVELLQRSPSPVALTELAHALAYLERRNVVFATAGGISGKSAGCLVDELIGLGTKGLPDGLITPRMTQAYAVPGVIGIASSIPADGLPGIATVVLENFVENPDFASLHLVTAVYASRILCPWVPSDRLLAATWRPVVAALAFIAPKRLSDRSFESPSWSEILTAAVDTLDDHIPKLVYACLSEAGAYPSQEPIYRWVAARAALTPA
jgi:hypothetical protein